MIWLLILPSSCYTFPFKLVFETLVLNQDSSFYLTSFNILITCLLNNIWILKGEVSCESLLGVKRLTFHTFQHLTPTAPCSMLTSIFFLLLLLVQCTLPNRRAAHSLPKDSMHILLAVVYTFLMVLTRICTMINSIINWISFPIFLWPYCLILSWFCREKLDWYSWGLIF